MNEFENISIYPRKYPDTIIIVNDMKLVNE